MSDINRLTSDTSWSFHLFGTLELTHQYVYHGCFISAVIAVELHNSSSDGQDHVSSPLSSSPLGWPGVWDRGQVRVAVVGVMAGLLNIV